MTDKTQVCEQDPSATVYHDGECPICNVEINAMKRLDKAKRIKWVDISKDQAALDAAGLSYQATMDRIHVKTADDSMITGVSGFMIVWAELPYFRRLVPIIRYVPGLQRLMEWAYVLFAKYRLKLTGKAIQSAMNDANASQVTAPTEQGVKIMSNKRYLITGGSGFIGSHLIPQLLAADNHVTVLTRTSAKTLAQFNHKISVVDKLDTLDNAAQFDVIINLAGQGIADKRWTDLVKQQLFDSRLLTTRALVEFMSRVDHKPALFISGSATGIYGLRDDQILTEDAQGDSSFSTKLCTDWEAEANAAEALGIRCCYLRTGIVLGKGGALSKMLSPFKFGLGGPMGNGQQWMSWIHINDLTGIIHHTVAHSDLSGPINGTAPNPVTNKVFASTLGNVLKRPAFLPLPSFVLKLLMGQMGEELLLSGHRAIPDKITRSGYSFIYESLEPALASIINNKSSPK